MNWSPASTGSTSSDFVILRSASVSTDVVSVALSLALFGSVAEDAVIVAVLLKTSIPAAVLDGTSTVMVSVAVSPSSKSMPDHTPVPLLNVPSVSVELIKVSPTGIVSVTTIPVASDGPLFVTSIV